MSDTGSTPVLNKQDFEQHLNADFVVQQTEKEQIMTLVEVSSINSDITDRGQADPFSLVFQSQSSEVCEQGIYTLAKEGFESVDLFLVPINADDVSVQYEAVFT